MPSNKTPPAAAMAAMAESIRIYYRDHADAFSPDEKRVIENLPSRGYIANEMDQPQLDVLNNSIRHIWKAISGGEPELEMSNPDAENLDGAYWFLPGDAMVSGYNHFTAAKDHKAMICAILDINPLVFEQMLSKQDHEAVIALLVARGGVRMLVDRAESRVAMQTNEESWLWAKGKIERMYHKDKIVKIIDLSQPYEGWQSGVTLRIKTPAGRHIAV